nr:ABC transporter permease [uncultured Sphaerochaeta sp.]
MLAVLKKEFKTYFITPVGYIFMGLFLLIAGITFVTGNVFSMNENYAQGTLSGLIMVFVLAIPLLTMRIYTEEQRQKTEQLLMTAPVPTWQIVLGKFLAASLLFGLTLVITVIFPILLSFHGRMEWAVIIGTYIGFFLLGCAFTSIGVFVSSLTDSQASAAIITLFLVLITWMVDFIASYMPKSSLSGIVFALAIAVILALLVYNSSRNIPVSVIILAAGLVIIGLIFLISRDVFPGLITKTLQWFSLTSRFSDFPRGILKLADMVYYLSFCGFFIYLTSRRIEKKRWS